MSAQVGPFLLVPVGFIAAGILFAVLGVRGRRRSRAFRDRAARATGVVTEVRRRWDSNAASIGESSYSFSPVVTFVLPDGRSVVAETPWLNPAPAAEGAEVTVLYDPADPARAVIGNRRGEGSIAGGCLAAFGIAFALFGVALLALLLLLDSGSS